MLEDKVLGHHDGRRRLSNIPESKQFEHKLITPLGTTVFVPLEQH